MLSLADKYQQTIQKATKRIMLFPYANNQQNKSIGTLECDIKLPSSYPFRSSQQIENNMPITHHITHQSCKQYPTLLQNQWPKSCIGLVLCQHYQNNQTYYVYGTGILIHSSIVLTSAHNVYCRRLNRQYTNIRFIVGVCGDKCSRIYDVMRVHYPKEYTVQERYDDYNFAVLQLYDDLSDSCGYVGWKTLDNFDEDEKYTVYGYLSDNQQGSFNLRQLTKHRKQQYVELCQGSGVLVKENQGQCSIMGLQQSGKKYILNEKIRNRINQWTETKLVNLSSRFIGTEGINYLSQFDQINLIQIYLYENYIGAQGCKYLSKANWTHLTKMSLTYNNIGAQGCKFLSETNWTHFTYMHLIFNNIGAQGCKYLSQTNWTHLTQIHLNRNNIDAQGCQYLSKANWKHLTRISLDQNNIYTQGCKYISQANWPYLKFIELTQNGIGAQGCKYISQANWSYLKYINLQLNGIGAQGCKYLSQVNWTHLTTTNLKSNDIGAQGCKYLSQSKWTRLTNIYLNNNNIGTQGCKHLSQAEWTLRYIDLRNNNINVIIDRLLLQQSYPKSRICQQ